MPELPPNKRLNGFTGEVEDAPALQLAPSPTDQRKLSADQTDQRSLIEKVREAVANDTARAIGVVKHVVEKPFIHGEDITVGPEGTQHVDVPAASTVLREQGVPVADITIPEQQTEVHSNAPSPVEVELPTVEQPVAAPVIEVTPLTPPVTETPAG